MQLFEPSSWASEPGAWPCASCRGDREGDRDGGAGDESKRTARPVGFGIPASRMFGGLRQVALASMEDDRLVVDEVGDRHRIGDVVGQVPSHRSATVHLVPRTVAAL